MSMGRLLSGLGLCGLGLLLGCSGRSGMACQDHRDCRTGLICNRPVLDSGQAAFGVCEPGRHGVGEVCQWSAECAPAYLCSNEVGQYTDDRRHGICIDRPAVPVADAGAADLADAGDGGDAGTDGGDAR